MFKNHLKIAWRSLKKQPFFTFLNTFGLAVGMAGGLLISLFIYDELSFDNMFTDADRIYRIDVENKNGGEINRYASVAPLLGPTLHRDYSQIEMVTRFRNSNSKLIRRNDVQQNVKEDHVIGVDTTFFDMFGLELLVGDTQTALKDANTLILTKTAAEKHFGLNDALGQHLLVDNEEVYTVTGVIEDMPKNSFLRNHTVFISMASFDDAESIRWSNWNFPTFIKLIPNANIESLQTPLSTIYETYMIPWIQTFNPGYTIEDFRERRKTTGNYMKWSTIALPDIHLYSNDIEDELSPNSDIQNVYILSFIGIFLILLACVNFMNLSTAHSLKRAKEVGIRKTLGSDRLGLIRQFLTEAGLVSFVSLLLAIVIGVVFLPFFNELSGKAISIPFGSPFFWLVLIFATILLGLFSGSYPAFFLSRFMPVKVLKGGGESSVGGGKIRNSLVVFQFAISVFLIISTLVVFQQLEFIQNKDLGFQKDQVLILEDTDAAGNQLMAFKQEVKQLGQVKQASLSSFLPTPSARSTITFFAEGDSLSNGKIFGKWKVDHDYVSTLDMEIIAGRDFDRQFTTDSTAIILNESAVAMFDIEPNQAIGMRITNDFAPRDKGNMTFFTVIGVIKNFHFESLRNNINAMSLSLGSNSNRMVVKLNAGDFSKTISSIEDIWNAIAPGQPFNYYFMDDSFNETYKAEQRLGRIFITFTILSILIACLGLFGLAAFNAEKRTKEIGVRKVLGASINQITYKLTIDFLKLVGVAILISMPLGWYAMNRWLEDFSYRIEIGWQVFALAAFLAIIISIVTVSYQSIKAAVVNPIKSLRTE
ncbi:ABC transporter permease [Aquimarina sediminis]|uniref:ABC transporter permease n=1 Tax=Aquimarina sediminis TaxID=2070536 RepID=UPI000CA04B4B|nr:ABC transporter permease [Aquimarina sediminis]